MAIFTISCSMKTAENYSSINAGPLTERQMSSFENQKIKIGTKKQYFNNGGEYVTKSYVDTVGAIIDWDTLIQISFVDGFYVKDTIIIPNSTYYVDNGGDINSLYIGGGEPRISTLNTPWYENYPSNLKLQWDDDFIPKQKTEWKEVVTVLFEGDQNCGHDYINSSPMQKGIGMACAVFHTGPCGCDWNWPHFRRICKKCLRHEDVKKECKSILLLKDMDYNDYLNILNEKH